MKRNIRLLSAALATALAVTLAGCSMPQAAESLPSFIPDDVIKETAGIPRDTVLFKVNGADVKAEDYLYWVVYGADSMSQYGDIDWTMDLGDGTTMTEYLKKNAMQTAKLYKVVENKATELGYSMSDTDKKDYNDEISSMKSQLKQQVSSLGMDLTEDGAFQYWLAIIGLSKEGFARVNQASYLYNDLTQGIFGKDGSQAPTDEDFNTWLDQNGTMRVKHILVKAVADQSTSDDGMATALEKATQIRAELSAAGDTEEKFDELMKADSDDVDSSGALNSPDGYTFGPDDSLTQEFKDASAALEIGQISEPVAVNNASSGGYSGYHIIMRLSADTDETRDSYAKDLMNKQVDSWMDETQVQTTDAYDNLDIQAFYTALTQLRTKMQDEAIPSPSPSPSDSSVPAGSSAPTDSSTPQPSASPAA